MPFTWILRVITAATAVLLLGAMQVGLGGSRATAAAADPVTSSGRLLRTVTSADGSRITHVKIVDRRNISLSVYSTAMKNTFTVNVQRPKDTSVPRPVLYLLNGAGGGEDLATWVRNTDAMQFFTDKNVNVVQPIGGAFSYYTNWVRPDPVLGLNEWTTFFTQELPPLIDAGLGTSGRNAIAGLSTSGTSVLALAEAEPGLYKSVAAYSGCAQISDPIGYNFVKLTVDVWGDGNVDNMHGPYGDPLWAANDPYVNAAKLRGIRLFISSGSGLPGIHDTPNDPHTLLPAQGGLAQQIVAGGVIEAAVNACSHNMQAKLNQLGIPATYHFPPTGTHSWGYWQDDLKISWPVLAAGLGLPPR